MTFGIASKFCFSLLLALCAFLLPWQINVGIIPLVIGLEQLAPPFRPISIQSRKTFVHFTSYLIVLGFLIIIINGVLVPGREIIFQIGGFVSYRQGVEFGVKIATRLSLLTFSILLFFVSTPLKEITAFLASGGLPTKLISIILLSTYFLGELPRRINQIFWAQEARGVPVRANIVFRTRSFFSILAPLVLSSIVESIERGIALELRGFRGNLRIAHPANPADIRMSIIISFFALCLIIWAVVWK